MQTDSLRAVIDLEDAAPSLLREQVGDTGAFLWPLVRWPLISALTTKEVGVSPAPGRVYRGQVLYEQLLSVLPSRHSPNRVRNVEHLFVTHGGTAIPGPRGIGNWLTDDFALSLGPAAAVLQDLPISPLSPRSRRPLNPRTYSFAPIFAREYRERRFRQLPASTIADADQAVAEMLDALDMEIATASREQVRAQVQSRVVRLSAIAEGWERILDRAQPRRIYMQTAAYGDRSNLIRLAHERGIRVAELQHGWVGQAHGAYNFGAAMRAAPLISSLPDMLLTFGDFWAEDLRFPGDIAAVGKPALERTVNGSSPWSERPNRILIVSSAFERKTLTEFALELARSIPADWQPVLRPHPSERHALDAHYPELLAAGFAVDDLSDVNVSIGQSRAVLGLTSTVLYEALPFGVHIGVIESGLSEMYVSRELFPCRLTGLHDVASFVDRIKKPPSDQASEYAARVWQPDAVGSFLREARQ